ncbi:hypothetical protein [Halanaerobium salsuginis]|jgi:tagatose-1,6-bisphosphate aldolase|uniref:Uncharacterized protein n=1 Tax=Halanaerobium salsuginis TaxID=29563 RepID=A0A1I4MJR8_9FIRM|nr:hypothetical protein [Halanaerobium salsuginis]SFM03315.1 hypothetical protein SAMN02983006_02626 [Halanaerobium salsuginis]
MSKNCNNCCCGNQNNLDQAELADAIEKKQRQQLKYIVKYRAELEELNCQKEELIERVQAYLGIVEEVEFTETELIISYDDRLVTPAEISDLIQ